MKMFISRQRLIILLNEMYYSGIKTLEVAYPPFDMLYSLALGEKCRLSIMNKNEYDERRDGFLKTVIVSEKEIPDSSAFKDIFTLSGVLPPENLKQIESEIDEKCKRNIFKGDKKLYIGFDTNILMHRLNKVILDIYRGRGGICISDIVSRELEIIWDKKYKFKELQNIPQQIQFMKLFVNQPIPKARQARLASVEYRFIRNKSNAKEIVTGLPPGEGADMRIRDSYKEFETENNVDVVLIGGDMNFTGMARNACMNVIEVKKQKIAPQEVAINWEQAAELIYVSAIIYGYISLNGMDIYGIWTGKNDDDWNAENLSINLEDDLAKKVCRDLNILQ